MRHRRSLGRVSISDLICSAFVGCFGLLIYSPNAVAAISYSALNSVYQQSFDYLPATPQNSLPKSPENASLGASPTGWVNDTASPAAGNFSIPGWYLFHTSNQAEGGFNGNQRMRAGSGGSSTGAYWSYGASGEDDRALGSLGSGTTGAAGSNMYMGLRIVNDTDTTLTGFSLGYDGEQWRASGEGAETLSFGYSLSATDDGDDVAEAGEWTHTDTIFNAVPSLNFTAPNSSAGPAAVDGNSTGKVALNGNVSGITWLPGAELWLRWSDVNGAAASQDGLGIDNISFQAPGAFVDADFDSIQSGSANAGTTWDNGQAPVFGSTYHVVSGHTVNVDGGFTGSVLRAETGGVVNISQAGNGQSIPNLVITANGNLTEGVSGDFSLGSPSVSPRNNLQLDRDVSFTIDAGPASPDCDLCLNTKISGAGNIDINSAPGTSVAIPAAASMGGTIRFNGTGDAVKINGTESIPRLEMNSTGQNRVQYIGSDVGNLTFNQTGSIDHVTTTASRLQGAGTLTANAAVTINMSTGYPDNSTQTNERRFQTNGLTGSGNVTINGTATDFTLHNSGDNSVSLNEFEIGTTGEPTGNLGNSTFAGTLTANNFVNVELRENLTRAAVVVNQNARVEFGHQVAHPNAAKSLSVGDVTVNNGGILEVGFEQVSADTAPTTISGFYQNNGIGTGHNPNHLNVTSVNGRNGNLTLESGATLRMQVNGTGATQFDSISATGNISLGGATLDVLVSPPSTENQGANSDPNDSYTPQVGDTFTILSIAPKPVAGDYDRSGTVGPEDLTAWKAAFGNTGFQATDGNNNGVVDAADYVIWRDHLGQSTATTGTITGEFNQAINILDPGNQMFGLTFNVSYTATSVQLQVANAFGVAAGVPEPTSLALLGMSLSLLGLRRRRR